VPTWPTKRYSFTLLIFHYLLFADFGFSQFLSMEERRKTLRGSPLYMAPEMLLFQDYDATVDLWSVGVIMYECLFGHAPYSSSNVQELTEKIKAQKMIEVCIVLPSNFLFQPLWFNG